LRVKILHPEKALVTRDKIESYLLSPVHPVGRHKAAFFYSLGYTQTDWRVLKRDILSLIYQDAQPVAVTEYGSKYEIRGAITGPNQRIADIVSGGVDRA
jgi:hypothetical protein